MNKKTTRQSTLWDIMGYEYRCADIDARCPEFILEADFEFAAQEEREPETIRGWPALADDIRAGDNAVPGAPRRVGPIVAKRSVRRLSHH